MRHLVTVTQIVRNFGDIIGRVYYKGEEFDIKKGANIVAHLSPPKQQIGLSIMELEKLFTRSAFLSSEELDVFEKDLHFMRETKEELTDKWD